MPQATGTFEVKLDAQDLSEKGLSAGIGRMSIDKQFYGELTGFSAGEMLSALTGVQESAGYVALERVNGSLHSRSGSFILQHSGIMARGASQLVISVVPDSGAGDLTGLTGQMTIRNEEGEHTYVFDYSLPEAAPE